MPNRRHLASILFLLISLVLSAAAQQSAQPLSIADEPLPAFTAGVDVRFPLHARGSAPPYHWVLASGDLPAGISLTPDGFLVGRPTKAGEFAFTVTVTDSAQPAHTINKDFRTKVTAALLLEWLSPPMVHGNQISGAVQVSNGSKDDYDLTVIIVAVNGIGRATALGYQHFTLKAETSNFRIALEGTPGAGSYIVHADAVAEIPAKNTILRRRLQTPSPLQIALEP